MTENKKNLDELFHFIDSDAIASEKIIAPRSYHALGVSNFTFPRSQILEK